MKNLYIVAVSLLVFLMGIVAFFVTPFALLLPKRDGKRIAWKWLDTPDEDAFIGMYEPTVQRIFDKQGWFMAAWYWFGVRNRAHGFASRYSQEAPGHWPETGSHERGEFFISRRSWEFSKFTVVTVFGWVVYKSGKYPSGFEYRPRMAIKTRRLFA